MNVYRLISFAGATLSVAPAAAFALALSFGNLAAPVASQAPADCAALANFPDVAQGSAGAGYAPARVRVSCVADSLIIESNGMINYEFVAMTPNALAEQDKTYTLPLNPVLKDEADITIQLISSIGVTVNGIPICTPNEAPQQGSADPYVDGILDILRQCHIRNPFDDLPRRDTQRDSVEKVGHPVARPYGCRVFYNFCVI